MATRAANPAPGNNTKLVSIDLDTGTSSDLVAGPGVKLNPSPLLGNDFGYLRKDEADPGAGIYYVSGKRGPRGEIRSASWSPDAKRVVFHKRLMVTFSALVKAYTPNLNYELSLTGKSTIPAFSPSGDRFVTNSTPSPNSFGASLFVTTVATGQSQGIYQDKTRNVLAGQWSPHGDKIIFGVGAFGAFFQGSMNSFSIPAIASMAGRKSHLSTLMGPVFRN